MYLFENIYGLLIAAAVIPAIILMYIVYKKDRLEKEPVKLLLSLIIYGVIATGLALITETIGSKLLLKVFPADSVWYGIIMYFIIVALSEEGFKYILLKAKTWKSPTFDCLFDGIVYAVFVSLGFALWENIMYVLRFGFSTAMVRAVTAVPGHACFGVFMGILYSFAKKYYNSGQKFKSKICRVAALLIPVLMHGCYDYIISLDSQYNSLIFIAFVAVMFFVVFRLVKKMSSIDKYID